MLLAHPTLTDFRLGSTFADFCVFSLEAHWKEKCKTDQTWTADKTNERVWAESTTAEASWTSDKTDSRMWDEPNADHSEWSVQNEQSISTIRCPK